MYEIIFILFIFLLSILFWINQDMDNKFRKLSYNIILLYGTLLISSRPMSTPDITIYKTIFEYVEVGQFYGLNLLSRNTYTGVEYGFIYAIEIYKFLFGENFRLFLVMLTFLTTHISIKSLFDILAEIRSKYRNDEYELLLNIEIYYFSYFAMVYQGVAIRAALAYMFCTLSFRKYLKNRKISAIIYMLLAFSIHRMSLVSLIILSVWRFSPSFKKAISYKAVSMSIIMGMFIIYLTPVYRFVLSRIGSMYSIFFSVIDYSSYYENANVVTKIDIKRLFLVVVFFVVLINLPKDIQLHKIMNIFAIGVVIMFLTMNINGSGRIYDYFVIYSIPIIACENIGRKNNLIIKCVTNLMIIINFLLAFRVWGYFGGII